MAFQELAYPLRDLQSRIGISEAIGKQEFLQTEQYQNPGSVGGICHGRGSEMPQREGFVWKDSKEEAKVGPKRWLGVEETKLSLKKLIMNPPEAKPSHWHLGRFG